ncbi:MAG: indole-3-glycerol phosphate synthase TrpC [Nitrospinae bacterium]|nr:indole-3-glycerol phosphate synthase TrpC [Nitrospinota bacterium]
MATILDKIFADKKYELDDTQRAAPLSQLKDKIQLRPPARDVREALCPGSPRKTRIIAEIKPRSPFKGELRKDSDPLEIARAYSENGAAAISVLTEKKYFGGSLDLFSRAREAVDVPLLRKDFIFAEYQVYESRASGADMFLLIATWLEKNQLQDLLLLGKELGLPALVETHHEQDLEKAFLSGADLIGINNRDLTTGKTDLGIARRLIKMAQADPRNILICESGIHARADVEEFEVLGAHAFLVGESLMTARDIPAKLKELLGEAPSHG